MLQTLHIFIQMDQNVKFSSLIAKKHSGNFEEFSLASTEFYDKQYTFTQKGAKLGIKILTIFILQQKPKYASLLKPCCMVHDLVVKTAPLLEFIVN